MSGRYTQLVLLTKFLKLRIKSSILGFLVDIDLLRNYWLVSCDK